jgi:hypothetical protein
LIINGKEYKKIVSICNKCHLISETTYLEYKAHYTYEDKEKGKDFFTKAGKFCGDYELYVEIIPNEIPPFNQK